MCGISVLVGFPLVSFLFLYVRVRVRVRVRVQKDQSAQGSIVPLDAGTSVPFSSIRVGSIPAAVSRSSRRPPRFV